MPAEASSQTHVIISPHFDDGVFSCGGTASQLTAAGHSVLVITMMGGLYQGELPKYADSVGSARALAGG